MRMEHFCIYYLQELLFEPLITPAFQEPILDVENLQVYGDIVNGILAAVDAQMN